MKKFILVALLVLATVTQARVFNTTQGAGHQGTCVDTGNGIVICN